VAAACPIGAVIDQQQPPRLMATLAPIAP